LLGGGVTLAAGGAFAVGAGFGTGGAGTVTASPVKAPGPGGVVDLHWEDLIPREEGVDYTELRAVTGIVEHGDLSTGFSQDRNVSVTTDYDGQRVRIPGFMVPMGYEDDGVRDFLLVPFLGACIHVPPPPPNQIVMVTTAVPYEVVGYFEPIWVEGTLEARSTSTDLADVGYRIPDADVTLYEG
ncbi:MAG: DUF3299 domain-containing protein, partial [Pseudomonadota bacterium]